MARVTMRRPWEFLVAVLGVLGLLVAPGVAQSSGAPGPVQGASQHSCWLDAPQLLTFDGRFLRFFGTCTYTLVSPCVGGIPTAAPPWEVTVSLGDPNSPGVFVRFGNLTIALGLNGAVQVAGVRVALPARPSPGVWLRTSGFFVLVSLDAAGLWLRWDGGRSVWLSLSPTEAGAVCGLCGNFNGDAADDGAGPDGAPRNSSADLGNSWKKAARPAGCSDDSGWAPQPSAVLSGEAEWLCEPLLDAGGALAPCHTAVNPDAPYAACVWDVAASGLKQEVLCGALANYHDTCARAGGSPDVGWRGPAGCPAPACPARAAYRSCLTACQPSCWPEEPVAGCTEACVEGCECPSGYVLQDGACQAAYACGCVSQGVYHAVNSWWWAPTCTGRVNCVAQGVTTELAERCGAGEVCEAQDGAYGCFKGRVTVECDADTMSARVPRVITLASHASELRLAPAPPGEPRCALADDGDYFCFRIAAGDCGTVVNETDSEITLQQTIVYGNLSRTVVIVRSQVQSITVLCRYPKRARLSVAMTPDLGNVTASEEGFGSFSFSLDLYRDASFSSPFTPSEYPLLPGFRQLLYLGASALTPLDVDLLLLNLFATPTADPGNSVRRDIIARGCDIDSTLTTYPSGVFTKTQVSFEAFSFTGYKMVYVHADVMLCRRGVAGTRCVRGCMPVGSRRRRRRRRGAAAAGAETAVHTVTRGPIIPQAQQTTVSTTATRDAGPGLSSTRSKLSSTSSSSTSSGSSTSSSSASSTSSATSATTETKPSSGPPGTLTSPTPSGTASTGAVVQGTPAPASDTGRIVGAVVGSLVAGTAVCVAVVAYLIHAGTCPMFGRPPTISYVRAF